MSNSEAKAMQVEVAAFVSDPETESAVAAVLRDLTIDNSIVRKGSIDNAIEYVTSQSSPRLLIVDITKSDLPLSDINSLADACEPGVEVIVVGEQNDIGLFRDLIQLGVSDYVAKPVTRELMRRAVESVRRGAKSVQIKGRVGKLVAVTGTRGGVGATTICANLGWVLSSKVSRRVAMVDLDFNFGALSLAFDQKPTPGLREAVENAHRVDQLLLERTVTQIDSRLSLLSCEEPLESPVRLEANAFEDLVETLSKQYHYVLVDVPQIAGAVYQKVLRMAAVRIVTIDPTLGSVRHAIRLLKALGSDDLDHQTLLVLNRRWASLPGDLSQEDIEKALGRDIDFVVPFGKNAAIVAENSGTVVAEQSAPIRDALMGLAQELSGKPRQKTSIWNRFFGGGSAKETSETGEPRSERSGRLSGMKIKLNQ